MLTLTARLLLLATVSASPVVAQTIDDGAIMPKRTVSGGVLYANDSWNEYWEGTLKRTNGNIGTLTTQSITVIGGYSVTDRLSLMAALPYVWTHASQGVLHDMRGFQDLRIAAKLKLFSTAPSSLGSFSGLITGVAALPTTDYTPDFYPLSIGTAGRRASARLTLNFESGAGWFARASTSYMWCANVRLNRDSYYTDGRLYLTNEVVMPNVLDHSLTAGIQRGGWRIPVSLVQQRTLGGGDIRRQDVPFVSNRMDFLRVDGAAVYALQKNLSISLGAGQVVRGRNVGQSATLTSGLFYALRL